MCLGKVTKSAHGAAELPRKQQKPPTGKPETGGRSQTPVPASSRGAGAANSASSVKARVPAPPSASSSSGHSPKGPTKQGSASSSGVGSKGNAGGGKASPVAGRSQSTGAVGSRSTSQSGSRPNSPFAQVGGLITANNKSASGIASSDGSGSACKEPVATLEPRESVQERLLANGFLSRDNAQFMHGRAYTGPLEPPRVTWKSSKKPRNDHDAPDWLTATEFEDVPEVLDAKCEQLANLLRLSRKTVLYTGAGISASVIGQAALSGQNKVGWKANKMEADPTPTHCALGLLGRQGIIHGWVQQNHDGLPQKAGFPQENINEIHGSWYDPCNPVVKYSGSLHDRAFPWMEEDAATADLVLVLGTSLGGLNADQVATNATKRSLRKGERAALGTVCINLQQTDQDGKMTIRLFGRSDDVLSVLLRKLGLPMPRKSVLKLPKESRVLVPYDANGRRLPEGSQEKRMWLDLSEGQKVRITDGHNIQGAKQPQFMHIGTTGKPGHGTVLHRDPASCSFKLAIEGAHMRLGMWWMDTAARGGVDVLPIVNLSPSFERSSSGAAGPSARPRAR